MDRQAGRQAGRGSVEYWMAGEALSLQWSGWKQQRPYGKEAGRQAGRGSVEYWMAGEALSLRWSGGWKQQRPYCTFNNI